MMPDALADTFEEMLNRELAVPETSRTERRWGWIEALEHVVGMARLRSAAMPPDVAETVARLRSAAQAGREIITEWDHNPYLFDDAADLIERLAAERARQLDACGDICRRIAGGPPEHWPPDMSKEAIWRESAERCEATIRAERRPAERAPTDGWRTDMENAPHQHVILLWGITDTETGNWKMATGCWWPGYRDEAGCWEWDGRRIKSYETQPTHWRPLLPPPPSAPSAIFNRPEEKPT